MNYDINRGSAQNSIAEIQAKTGDIAGAIQVASLITRPDYKSGALRIVGEVQFASGDIAGAQKTLALAAKAAERIDSTQTKSYRLREIASAQAEAGDVVGAQKSVALIQGSRAELSKTALSASSKIIKDEIFKSEAQAQRAVAEAQQKAGDIAGARNTLTHAQKAADLIQTADYHKASEQYAVARAQIRAADIAGAQRSADLIKDPDSKKSVQREIAEVQAKVGIAEAPNSTRQPAPDTKLPIKPVTVADWIKEMEGDLNTGPFLDFAGYLKSLPPSDDPQKVFDGLYKAADTIVRAKNVTHKMLRQQATR